MKKVSLLLIIVGSVSCSTVEILPGLCFNDKDKTHLCEEQETIDPPKERTPEEKWEMCEPWLHNDGEVWVNCMMIA